MLEFDAKLEIIGSNPYISVPRPILKDIFRQANKTKGAIQIRGTVDGKSYQQTLVRYRGCWRLYVNMEMLKNSPKRIGEMITITIDFDPSDRTIEPHPKLTIALANNKIAKKVFENLPPSRRKEIVRYISFLKTEESINRNVDRAINFLLGKGRFVGRDKP